MSDHKGSYSRRDVLRLSVVAAMAGGAQSVFAMDHGHEEPATTHDAPVGTGPVGYTSFIHPSATLGVDKLSIGAASIIDAFVSLQGRRAVIGNAVNLQDNDRLINFDDHHGRGDLKIGDGTFTAHGVTFVGKVVIGQACGTGINAVVQNTKVGDASFIGLRARILGARPEVPIEIPDASLVLFGAQIHSQADVSANIMPVPAPFSLFFADVDQENLVLARGFNLLYRAAARMIPFSSDPSSPRNPGVDFPDVAAAFGKQSVAPPTIYRRGTGVIPGRQATLGDLGYARFPPLSPVPRPSTPALDQDVLGQNAPPSASAESGARFIVPRVASPELILDGGIVLGGCELGEGVVVSPGAYILGDVAPTVSIGRGTVIGSNTSVHELSFTSCRIGENCHIGKHCVLHGPLEIGNHVTIGDGAILFGPTVRDGVTIGARALIFGPVEVTGDIPEDAIVVAPGNEFLIAPSAPLSARLTLRHSREMLTQWQRVQDSGSCCGCGLGSMALMSAPV